MVKSLENMPCAMTVAGSDSGAGAGIQADLFAIAANGVYGCSAIAALTAQNPDHVTGIEAAQISTVTAQMQAIEEFYKPRAAKTGMLFSAEIVSAVSDFFEAHREISLVVDPVIVSTSGAKLLEDDAIEIVKKRLIPLAAVFTPNLDEAAVLLECGKIDSRKMAETARALCEKFGAAVLLKGGHMESDDLEDVFVSPAGECETIRSARVKDVDTHGSGCTLSAAMAANLAKGAGVFEACKKAHAYLLAGMQNPIKVGGKYFINHFPRL